MVRLLSVPLCVIDLTASRSFFALSARLPRHSPDWPEQRDSRRAMLECGNRHRHFASRRQFLEGRKRLVSWLSVGGGERVLPVGSEEQSIAGHFGFPFSPAATPRCYSRVSAACVLPSPCPVHVASRWVNVQ